MELKINEKCIGCGACVADCPVGVLTLVDGRPQVRAGKAESCMDCRHCLAVCPVGALALNGFSAEDCISTENLPLPSAEQMRGLLMARRSVRRFAPEELPHDRIVELLEALKCVPTGCNARNLTFRVVASRARMDELRAKVVELLLAKEAELPDFLKAPVAAVRKNPELDPFFRHAPHLLIVQGDPKTGVTPQVDCDAACAYFDLLAQGSGWGVTWCGFLRIIIDAVPEVADVFGIPRGTPFYAMMFGAPAVRYARTVCRRDGARVEFMSAPVDK